MYAIQEMLPEHKRHPCHTPAETLRFMLPSGRIVGTEYVERDPETGELITQTLYNCSRFGDILAVRQDPLGSECGCILLAQRYGNIWILNGPRIPNAQDPNIMVVDGIPILTYIKYESDCRRKITDVYQWFCRLATPNEPFAIGQPGQKGGRLLKRIKGKIPVMGRRQAWPTLRGQLTYTEIDSLDELQQALAEAPIVEGVTNNDAWVGANQLLQLGQSGENIGVFMHIAEMDSKLLSAGVEVKSYYAAAGIFNRKEHRMIELEIILDADDLQISRYTKMDQLRNVIYPGSLIAKKGAPGTYKMYAGASDFLCFQTEVKVDLFRRYAVA